MKQVGGTHYQAQYQHWDWALDLDLPCLIYAATKYVDRIGAKGDPVEEIDKAISYVEKFQKWLEENDFHPDVGADEYARDMTAKYDLSRQSDWLFGKWQKRIVWACADIRRREDLTAILGIMHEFRSHLMTRKNSKFTVVDNTGQKNPFGYETEYQVGDEVLFEDFVYKVQAILLPEPGFSTRYSIIREAGKMVAPVEKLVSGAALLPCPQPLQSVSTASDKPSSKG